MAKLIIVWNEHPAEASAGVVAKKLHSYLEGMGFAVSIVPIRGKLQPVFRPRYHDFPADLDLDATLRPLGRLEKVEGIARQNQGALILSFHNKSGGSSTRSFIDSPGIWESDCLYNRNAKVSYVQVNPELNNLLAIEIATAGSAKRWGKGKFLGAPPNKIHLGDYGESPPEVYSVQAVKEHDPLLFSEHFISALAKGVLGLAKIRGFQVSRAPIKVVGKPKRRSKPRFGAVASKTRRRRM